MRVSNGVEYLDADEVGCLLGVPAADVSFHRRRGMDPLTTARKIGQGGDECIFYPVEDIVGFVVFELYRPDRIVGSVVVGDPRDPYEGPFRVLPAHLSLSPVVAAMLDERVVLSDSSVVGGGTGYSELLGIMEGL